MSTKTFLIVFLVAYVAVALPTILLYGPPGFTAEYLEEYRAETDHYYEVIKSPAYKRYEARPELVKQNPDIWTEDFQEDVAFVENYKSREAYKEETHRRHLFELIFEVLNWAAVTLLIGFFAYKPLLNMLDNQIEEIRERIEGSKKAREKAQSALQEAEQKMAALPEEERAIDQDAEDQKARILAELNEQTQAMLKGLDEDAELRKKLAEQEAAMTLKRELVSKAVAQVEQILLDTRSEQRQRLMIEQFMEGLESAGAEARR